MYVLIYTIVKSAFCFLIANGSVKNTKEKILCVGYAALNGAMALIIKNVIADTFWNFTSIAILGCMVYFLMRERIYQCCLRAIGSKTVEAITVVVTSLLISSVGKVFGIEYESIFWKIFYLLILLVLLYSISYGFNHLRTWKSISDTRSRSIVVTLLCLFLNIFVQIVALNTRDNILDAIYIAIFSCMPAFGSGLFVLWLIDRYQTHRHTEKIMEDNTFLAQQYHKSKEILPALTSTLEELQNKSSEEDVVELQEEIETLRHEAAEGDTYNRRRRKTYPSTGMRILDEMFIQLGYDAAERDIEFDVVAPHEIRSEIRGNGVPQGRFQTLIGDLVRNAFRAVERGSGNRKVLLMLYVNKTGFFQVDCYDSGAPFPKEVRDHLGERGVTTGGTGNGLADTVQFTHDYHARILIDEDRENDPSFTKKISIIFDEE